jgi:4-hydroxythreonine-4-phosphate dehydrogenase
VSRKPVICVHIGDPTGIGPELTARLLADRGRMAAADVVVFGDGRILDAGLRAAGLGLDIPRAASFDEVERRGAFPALVDARPVDAASEPPGRVSAVAGRFVNEVGAAILDLCAAARVDGYVFAPFNKEAMKLGGALRDSELETARDRLDRSNPGLEINILDEMWTTRVTSHIAFRDIVKGITPEKVLEAIRFLHRSLVEYGKAEPRLAVAALNPHGGEHGLFGDEEQRLIAPAIEAARRERVRADGPFPADTIFLKVKAGQYDAVVGMYHDQCQIATKLLGFDRGVTYLAGFRVPITTPAHGTAFDIAGRGTANAGPIKRAFDVSLRIASARLAAASPGSADPAP